MCILKAIIFKITSDTFYMQSMTSLHIYNLFGISCTNTELKNHHYLLYLNIKNIHHSHKSPHSHKHCDSHKHTHSHKHRDPHKHRHINIIIVILIITIICLRVCINNFFIINITTSIITIIVTVDQVVTVSLIIHV